MTMTNFQFIECTCDAPKVNKKLNKKDKEMEKNGETFFQKLERHIEEEKNGTRKKCICLQKKIDAGETDHIVSMIIYPGLIEYLDKKKQEGTLTGWDKERYDYIHCEGEYKTMRERLHIELTLDKKKENK